MDVTWMMTSSLIALHHCDCHCSVNVTQAHVSSMMSEMMTWTHCDPESRARAHTHTGLSLLLPSGVPTITADKTKTRSVGSSWRFARASCRGGVDVSHACTCSPSPRQHKKQAVSFPGDPEECVYQSLVCQVCGCQGDQRPCSRINLWARNCATPARTRRHDNMPVFGRKRAHKSL